MVTYVAMRMHHWSQTLINKHVHYQCTNRQHLPAIEMDTTLNNVDLDCKTLREYVIAGPPLCA